MWFWLSMNSEKRSKFSNPLVLRVGPGGDSRRWVAFCPRLDLVPSVETDNPFFPTYCSGHDPSRLFQRSVNKRNVPDYYDIIKEPMALSILKQKINKREYKSFSEFVRDCALVCCISLALSPTGFIISLR